MEHQYHKFYSFSEKRHVSLIIYGKEVESKGMGQKVSGAVSISELAI